MSTARGLKVIKNNVNNNTEYKNAQLCLQCFDTDGWGAGRVCGL